MANISLGKTQMLLQMANICGEIDFNVRGGGLSGLNPFERIQYVIKMSAPELKSEFIDEFNELSVICNELEKICDRAISLHAKISGYTSESTENKSAGPRRRHAENRKNK